MKNITMAAVALLVTAGGANAADIYQGGSTKDAPGTFDAPTTVNWTGFYIGGRAGYGHSNHDLTLEAYRNEVSETPCDQPEVKTASSAPCGEGSGYAGETLELFNLNGLDSSGFTGGGQVGFDVQRGIFVGGIFGSYDISGAETTISSELIGLSETAIIEQGNSWSIGARAGLLVNPRTLAYVLAAYTQTEFTFAGLGDEGADKDVNFSGITAGAGVEYALTNNIFMGIEGTHTFYDKETLFDSCSQDESCGEPGRGGIRLVDEIGETKVMGTLKIKLNSGLPNFD